MAGRLVAFYDFKQVNVQLYQTFTIINKGGMTHMNQGKVTKYSILVGPILLFLMVFWLLKGIFILSTESVRGVHLPKYASIEEDTPALFARKDTTQQPTKNKVAQLNKK